MRKMIIGLLLMFFAVSVLTPGAIQAADDLSGHKYEEQMRKLMELGVIVGYDDGTIQPERAVTRAEFAKMVVMTFELGAQEAAETANLEATQNFKDVSAASWYAPYVATAFNSGIVNGFEADNTFRPNALITREQMASMVARALHAKGILVNEEEMAELSFTDSSTILSVHKPDVQLLTHLGVMTGNTDNTFKSKNNSTRWMVALVMFKSLDHISPPENLPYQVSSITDGQLTVVKQFNEYADAKKYVQSSTKAEVIEKGHQIVWIRNGLAVVNSFTEIYPTTSLKAGNSAFRPYVSSPTELKFIDAGENFIKVELAGVAGYVSPASVNLIPEKMKKGQSYYKVSDNGGLVHMIFNHLNGSYASTGVIGKAPSAMAVNKEYYSWDGSTFTDANGKLVTQEFQYFNQLPLQSVSGYTAAELDKYLEKVFPYIGKTSGGKKWSSSPLIGTGKFFKEAESKYKVNALYLMAHAIHESAWGTSKIAQDKFNLFGYGAVDADAYNGAYTYSSFKESIEEAAKKINATYHNPRGAYYNGSVLGNKAIGMNVRYASDPYWGEKVAGHMYRADSYLGGKNISNYSLFYTTVDNLKVRRTAGTSSAEIYSLPRKGMPVIKLGETNVSGALWYKILSENVAYTEAYSYGKGSLGEYLKPLPIAK